MAETIAIDPTPMRGRHLWEVDHPYYAEEGNFYSNDAHATHSTVEDFLDAERDNDMDLNLVYRWDWRPWVADDHDDDTDPHDTLYVFFIGQRKARARSAEARIEIADRERVEPLVRAYLQPRLIRLLEIWAPLITPPTCAHDECVEFPKMAEACAAAQAT